MRSADEDGDGIPSIGEYLLGLNPLSMDDTHHAQAQTINGLPTLTLSYTPDTSAKKLGSIEVNASTDLETWPPLPPHQIIDLGDGSYRAQLAIENDLKFLRIEFSLSP